MVGNRIFGHALILCMAAALLLTPWGGLRSEPRIGQATTTANPTAKLTARETLEHKAEQAVERMAEQPEPLTLVFGFQGHILLGQVQVPYWTIVAALALGSLISSLNLLRWTELSSVLTFALFGWAAAGALVATVHFYLHGQVGTGSVLALTCALAGLAISPSDQASTIKKIYRFEADSRQSRAAA